MVKLSMFSSNIAVENKSNPQKADSPRIIIIGLGNPILGDDGVGWQVAETVKTKLGEYEGISDQIEVKCFALGGLSLMEQMVGYDQAIIIDAMQNDQSRAGQVYNFSLDELPDHSTGHMTAAHDTSLQTALKLGREMGADLPHYVHIVGIEAKQLYEFSEELSPAVATAIPAAVQSVMNRLTEWGSSIY